MNQLNLFDAGNEHRPEQAARLSRKLRVLADRGVYLGTSSWKYEGWIGTIYSAERYQTRGKLSRKKFEAECLAEYAETFPAVCGDFSFYQFPSDDYWQRLFSERPRSFLFSLKVPEQITVPRWPKHARYGNLAGAVNESFLDARMFRDLFLGPLEPYRDRLGVLIFEFGTINRATFADAFEFLTELDPFLESLPDTFRYAVEIRNSEYLRDDYFATLHRHNVAHVFSAWTRMPIPLEQMEMPGAFTADFTVARAILKIGRDHENANKRFQPYDRIQEPNPPAREALRALAERAIELREPAFLFANNSLEGNSPSTIEAVADALLAELAE